MTLLEELLNRSAARHQHLCPRQVLGVRMGLCAGEVLGLDLPQSDKRLFTFMETDGCAADGVGEATGCWVGRRTMQVLDFGKVAATFVDTHTGCAFRIHPHPQSRQAALRYAPQAEDNWHAYRAAYQIMPTRELLIVQPVNLTVSMQAIISRDDARAICAQCGEEIYNEREVRIEGRTICRACAGQAYYRCKPADEDSHIPSTLAVKPVLAKAER